MPQVLFFLLHGAEDLCDFSQIFIFTWEIPTLLQSLHPSRRFSIHLKGAGVGFFFFAQINPTSAERSVRARWQGKAACEPNI